jgi:hypothetical protein
MISGFFSTNGSSTTHSTNNGSQIKAHKSNSGGEDSSGSGNNSTFLVNIIKDSKKGGVDHGISTDEKGIVFESL